MWAHNLPVLITTSKKGVWKSKRVSNRFNTADENSVAGFHLHERLNPIRRKNPVDCTVIWDSCSRFLKVSWNFTIYVILQSSYTSYLTELPIIRMYGNQSFFCFNGNLDADECAVLRYQQNQKNCKFSMWGVISYFREYLGEFIFSNTDKDDINWFNGGPRVGSFVNELIGVIKFLIRKLIYFVNTAHI